MNPISPTSKLFMKRTALVLAAAAAIAGGAGAVRADTPPVAVMKGEGLDSLDDRALATELSARGIGNLLDHYFKNANISEADRRAIKSVGALSELRKANSPITYGEKLRRVREVADGIDAVLPTFKNPLDMMQTADIIKEFGLNEDVNSLEYWGEDPVTQAHLKPLSAAVIKLYAAAKEAALRQQKALELQNLANPVVANKWQEMDDLSKGAEYNKDMAVYADCIATSAKAMVDGHDQNKKVLTPAEIAAKKKMDVISLRLAMANDAITGLTDYDNPENQVQARIRTMIAKLYMAAGEYKKAREKFATVYAEPSTIVPPPNPFEQNEARYFSVVTELLAGDLAAANAGKAELDKFMQKLPNLLQNPIYKMEPASIAQYMKGIAAADELLQWRIDVLQGDQAKTPAEKATADTAAETVLVKLRVSHPEFAVRIDQQLVNRMPANKVIDSTVPPSLLLALLKKGMNESYKADPEKPDETILKKGIEAALAIITRKDPLLTAQNVSEAKLAIAKLQERLGNDVDAANAYLDFAVEDFNAEPKKATDAFDTAGYLVLNKMAKLPVKPKGYEAAYSRFLPIAINVPFNHKELAFAYAEELRGARDFEQAIKYYKEVPKDSGFYGSSQYKIMLALYAELDPDQNQKKLEAAEKTKITAELVASATEIRKLGVAPKDNIERSRAIAATKILAETAKDAGDSKRIVEVLQGFDQLVDGLVPNGNGAKELADLNQRKKEWKRGAKEVMVRAEMQQGQVDAAVKEVVQLVGGATDMDGMALVRELLDKLDEDYNKAKAVDNLIGMRQARKGEASLTGYLVEWANPAKQANPKVVEYYYDYMVYDARMLREAGELSDNPEEKKKLLTKSRDSYLILQSKMKDRFLNKQEVKDQIAAGTIDPADPDWQVSSGLAFTTFELGDFKTARDELVQLVQNKKLGAPEILDANGVLKPNDRYWEGTFKYLWSGYEISKGSPKDLEDVARDLKNLLIRGVPPRWAPDFERLRKLIAPDFNPDVVAARAKPLTPPPATQPHK